MENFKDMLKYLRKREHLSQAELAERLKISKSTVGMYELGKREPDFKTLALIADFFKVDMNFLLGKGGSGSAESVSFSPRDERDIEKRLEAALQDLEDTQNALMFSGTPLDEETRELLKVSLENSLRIGKINAKKKFSKHKKK